jgi:hypothetical protein
MIVSLISYARPMGMWGPSFGVCLAGLSAFIKASSCRIAIRISNLLKLTVRRACNSLARGDRNRVAITIHDDHRCLNRAIVRVGVATL